MKKIFLSFTLLLFGVTVFSQAPIAPVKIDSLVTVSLPQTFQKKDTLGQHIFSANSTFGYMTVIVEPNGKNNTPLKKEKDLNKVFQDYIKSIQTQSPGSVAENVRDTTVGTLKAKVFTLKIDNGGTSQFINFTLIYTQDATYTFEYVYPQERSDLVKSDYTAFISSIRLSHELQRNDQYLSNNNGMSSTTKIEIGGGALVIILVVFLVIRRKRLAVS
ncbi:MAG: hypothetical protein JWP45_244 [Mucilaginibacter sp.]|jgi:hypothetical protein|nr:hypothetical protein [Mucilaginibacter sp.]